MGFVLGGKKRIVNITAKIHLIRISDMNVNILSLIVAVMFPERHRLLIFEF